MTVTADQLRNLADRAGMGLTPDEQQRLRDGIDQLAALLDAESRTLAEVDQRCDRYAAQLAALRQVARDYCPACGRGDAAPTVEDWEQQKQRADHAEAALARQAQETATWRATANTLDAGGPGTPRHRAEQAETALAEVRALRDRWVKAGPPPLGQPVSRWWDRRLVELAAALDTPPAAGTLPARHVHVTITNPDAGTATRAALSLADWIAAEFPAHHVTTDAREWDEPGPG